MAGGAGEQAGLAPSLGVPSPVADYLGRVNMRSRLFIAATVLAAAVAIVAVAGAGKIGNGSSSGSALVFVPNPVQSLGDESLTDQKDSDAAVRASVYHAVTLTNLDGSGFLQGDYADVYSSTGVRAFSPTNTFAYTRSDDRF